MAAKVQITELAEESEEYKGEGRKPRDPFSLAGQSALITGATSGIGQSMALALAEAGANIILVQVRHQNCLTI